IKANIIVDDEGRGRISDFGLARIMSGGQRTGLTTDTSHTGTLRYLAYELVNTEGHIIPTKEGDVYALGCLALELIFLQVPYAEHTNPGEIYKLIGSNTPPAVEVPVDGAPSEQIQDLWTFLQRCWDIDPKSRPTVQDCQQYVRDHKAELLTALGDSFQPRSTLAAPPETATSGSI
ncbi:7093_t:CDS:2, partial [Acaulospora colombiana]